MFEIMNRVLAKLTRVAPAAACVMIAGCAVDAGESAEPEEIGSAEDPIVNGTAVSSGSLLAKSTVGVWFLQGTDPYTGISTYSSCTGVIVGYRHVLTAAHCKPKVGGTVKFYTGPLPSGVTRTVTDVDLRAGVNPATDDLVDANGKFADIALLTLDAGIPSTSLIAELPLSYPGNDVEGYMVGRGRHDNCDPAWTCIDGQPNDDEDLRYYIGHTYSSDNGDGHFLGNEPNVNKGDSGGPFYTYNSATGRMRVHGVLWGVTFEWGARTKYTSIEHHLSWLLEKMSYTGGMLINDNYDRPGSTYSITSTQDFRRCALACAQDSVCKSFSHYSAGIGSLCYMKNAVPSLTPLDIALSGAKWSL